MLKKRERADLFMTTNDSQSIASIKCSGIRQKTSPIGDALRQALENGSTKFNTKILVNDSFVDFSFTVVAINFSQSCSMNSLDFITYDELVVESHSANVNKNRLFVSQIVSIIN